MTETNKEHKRREKSKQNNSHAVYHVQSRARSTSYTIRMQTGMCRLDMHTRPTYGR